MSWRFTWQSASLSTVRKLRKSTLLQRTSSFVDGFSGSTPEGSSERLRQDELLEQLGVEECHYMRHALRPDVEHMQLEGLVHTRLRIAHVQRRGRLAIGGEGDEAHVARTFGRTLHPREGADGLGALVPAVERRHLPDRILGEQLHQLVNVVRLERGDVARPPIL